MVSGFSYCRIFLKFRGGGGEICLFVSYEEEQIFQNYQGPVPELFKPSVDDQIGATSMPRFDLENYISLVCNFHPALQFGYQITSSYLSFPDITLQINDNHITTLIFYKETDPHSHLHSDSSNNPKCITSIPFSELLHLSCLCRIMKNLRPNLMKCLLSFLTTTIHQTPYNLP